MSYFLFVAEIPASAGVSTAPHYSPNWIQFEDESNTILKPVKTCIRHQKNVWLIPVENSWPYLSSMSEAADRCKLSCSVLLIEKVTDLTGKQSSSASIAPLKM